MVETENRYLEEGMEFVSFFMFITWNVLLTNLTFGKGESLSFNLLMSTTLFMYFLYSLLKKIEKLKLDKNVLSFLIQKE